MPFGLSFGWFGVYGVVVDIALLGMFLLDSLVVWLSSSLCCCGVGLLWVLWLIACG